MLRLPDPEPPAHPLAPVPDPVPTPGRAAPPSPTLPRKAAGKARNPLFRAIDGGLAESDAEARPKAPRAAAVRTRAESKSGRRAPAPRRVRNEGRDAGPGEAASRLRPECYGCPVGLAFGAVRNASPETLDHLVAASREMVSAARSVMEALETNLDRYSKPAPMQRVDLD